MAPAAAPPPISPPAAAPQPELLAAWPRSAQLTTAFLLGIVLTLLGGHVFSMSRWASQPAELQRGSLPAYAIDLNQASRAELMQVPGIGQVLAERIDLYRKEHGGFRSVDELLQVQGIGPATLRRVRSWVCVGDELAAAEIEPAAPRRSFYPADTGAMDRRPAGKKETALASPIDINQASAEELQRLSGIGPVLSQRIIDARKQQPFKTVDDLRRVSGIGPKTLDKLRPSVIVGSDAAHVATAEPAKP